MTDKQKNRIIINISSTESLSKEILSIIDIVVFSPSVYNDKTVSEFVAKARQLKPAARIYLNLPVIANNDDMKCLRESITSCRPDGVLADNLYGFTLADELNIDVIAGMGLNIYNSESAKYFLSRRADFIYSAELNLNEIKSIENKLGNDARGGFVFVHGNMRAMTLNHCPVILNTKTNCENCGFSEGMLYEDEKGYNFPLRRVKVSRCYFELYNSVQLAAAKKLKDRNLNMYLVLFNLPAEEIYNIIKIYTRHSDSETDFNGFTTGHLFKGVK